jgi:hypothetical protein
MSALSELAIEWDNDPIISQRQREIRDSIKALQAECTILGHVVDNELVSYQDPKRMVLKNPFCLYCGIAISK